MAAQAARIRRILGATTRRGGGAADGAQLTANVAIGDSSVFGAAPENKVVLGKLFDAKGNLIAEASDLAEGGSYNFFFGRVESVPILPRYKVQVDAGVRRVTIVVPAFTASLNRVNDTVSGRAPRNAGIQMTVTHFVWTVTGIEQTPIALSDAADKTGQYSESAAPFGFDIVGGDTVSARYTLPRSSNQVTVNATAPYVAGYLGRAQVTGYGQSNSIATLSVRNRFDKVVFNTPFRVSLSGQFKVYLTDGQESTALQPRMTIGLDLPGVSAKLPQVDGRLNVTTTRVSGFAPPGLFMRVSTQQPFFTHYGQIDKRGKFSIDLSPGGPVSTSTVVSLIVRLPGGDLVYRFIE